MFVSVGGHVHTSAGPLKDKGVRSSLELEVGEVVSCPPWVLGTECRSYGRAGFALNRCTISQALGYRGLLLCRVL